MSVNRKNLNKALDGPWETWNTEFDIQGKFVEDGNTLYISFQGSRSVKDTLINFNFPIKPYKHMNKSWWAHRGFVNAYHSIRDMIAEKAKSFQKIKISGYSQGSAYGILCHEDLVYRGMDVESILYAPPRVMFFWKLGNIKDRFENVTLCINRGDPVPMVPPAILGYRHIGEKFIVGKWFNNVLFYKNHFPVEYKKFL